MKLSKILIWTLLATASPTLVSNAQGQESLTAAQREQLDEATRLSQEVPKLYSSGDYAGAEKVAKKILSIREQYLGIEHPKTLTSLNNLGVLYEVQGRYAEAESVGQRVLKIREKILGLDHPDTAQSLNNLAENYKRQGKYAEAEPLLQRTVAIWEKTLGPEHPDTATSLNNLAGLYSLRNDYEAAEPLYQRALKIREKAFGSEHPTVAQSLNKLALVYKTLGDYTEAKKCYERALSIYETKSGEEHPETAQCLNNLAGLYNSQNDFPEAKRLYERALRIREKSLGPNHPMTAESLDNLARCYHDQGDYVLAESLYLRALSIREEALGSGHSEAAISLGNLALLRLDQGNYADAEPLFKRAVEINEKALGTEHLDTAISLSNLAEYYKDRRNYAMAERLYQRSLKIREKKLGAEHESVARILNNLASIYQSQGDLPTAESLFEKAINITANALGSEHPNTATAMNNMALLHKARGNYTAAESLYRNALRITEKSCGYDHPITITCVHNLAILLDRLESSEATTTFDRARQSTYLHVLRALTTLNEKEQQLFLNKNFEAQQYIALSHALDHSSDALAVTMSTAWVANGKGLAQDVLAERNLLLRDLSDPKLRSIAAELQTTRKQLATIVMSTSEEAKKDLRKRRIDELTALESRLSKQLALETVGDGRAKEWISTEELQRAIPKNAVLIDIARFDYWDAREDKGLPARYAAWVTPARGQGEPKLIDLGLAEEIDRLVHSIRQGIQADGAKEGVIAKEGESEAVKQLNAQMKQLAEKLWHPLAAHVGSATSILLSPDGGLWLAPWAALPVSEQGDPLIKNYSLRLLTRGRDLLSNRGSTRQAGPPVIFADPKFDSEPSEKKISIEEVLNILPDADDGTLRSFSAKGLLPKVMRLPSTASEARFIEPNIEKITSSKPQLYQQRFALESVAKVLQRPQLAIFATHGFFLPKQEAKKDDGIESLASQETPAAILDTSGQPIENPLLRCGLLFAGCNQGGKAIGDDDGILTGMEITSIDFRGTDLVVLSACETGVGDVNNGEGVAGLRQAFQLAGAKAVVSTLWQIPDKDSAIIMNDFFANVADGQSASEAMRKAQLKRIESRTNRYGAAHPLFWAAWTVTE